MARTKLGSNKFVQVFKLNLSHTYIYILIYIMDNTDCKVLKAASMYRVFQELMNMDFELYLAKVSNLVHKLKLYDEYLIVNGANSR